MACPMDRKQLLASITRSVDEELRLRNAVWSKNSCGFTHVVFQKPSEPFATLHRALTLCVLADGRKEQHIALTLVIALMMIMSYG
jgi:hypothetical protein